MNNWPAFFDSVFGGRKSGRVPVSGAMTGRVSHGRGKEVTTIYDGLLSSDVIQWVQSAARDGYTYAVELRAYPSHDWYDSCLKTQEWTYHGEDCMGGQYTRQERSTLYMIIRTDTTSRDEKGYLTGGGFLLFNNPEDHANAVASLVDLLVNPTPFKTAFRKTA